jgi:hypothetical protein
MCRLCWTVESSDSARKTSCYSCTQGYAAKFEFEPEQFTRQNFLYSWRTCFGLLLGLLNKIKLPLMLVLVMASSDFYLQPRLGKSLI